MSRKSKKVTEWEGAGDDDLIGDGGDTPLSYMSDTQREAGTYDKPSQFNVKRGPFYAVDGPAYTGLYAATGKNAYGVEFIVMTAKKEDLPRVWNNALIKEQINWERVYRVAVIRDEDLREDIEDII